jgi:hypothetical protein
MHPSIPVLPADPASNPAVVSAAWTFDVVGAEGEIHVTPPSGEQLDAIAQSIVADYFGLPPGHPDLSILGGDVIELTASALDFGVPRALPGVGSGFVRDVSFLVSVRNLVSTVDLIAPTFPIPPAGTTSPLLIPIDQVVTVTSGSVSCGGGAGGGTTDCFIESPSEGDVFVSDAGGVDSDGLPFIDGYQGAPHSFFNDVPCEAAGTYYGAGNQSDCRPFKLLPAPVAGGGSSAPVKIHYTVDQTVNQFRVRLLVAADLMAGLPDVNPPTITSIVGAVNPTFNLLPGGVVPHVAAGVDVVLTATATDDVSPESAIDYTFSVSPTADVHLFVAGNTAEVACRRAPLSVTVTVVARDLNDNETSQTVDIECDPLPNVFMVWTDAQGREVTSVPTGTTVELQICTPVNLTRTIQGSVSVPGLFGLLTPLGSGLDLDATQRGIGACENRVGPDLIEAFTGGVSPDSMRFQNFTPGNAPGEGVVGVARFRFATVSPGAVTPAFRLQPGTWSLFNCQSCPSISTTVDQAPSLTIVSPPNLSLVWTDGAGQEVNGPVPLGAEVALQVCTSVSGTRTFEGTLVNPGVAGGQLLQDSAAGLVSTASGVGACANPSGTDVVDQLLMGPASGTTTLSATSTAASAGVGPVGLAEIRYTAMAVGSIAPDLQPLTWTLFGGGAAPLPELSARTLEVSANVAPNAQTGGPYAAGVSSPVSFVATLSSDPENAALTYSWTFGDGSAGVGPTPVHSYAAGGVYPVELVVTDPGLASDTATTYVVVAAGAAPNLFLLWSDRGGRLITEAQEGDTVYLDICTPRDETNGFQANLSLDSNLALVTNGSDLDAEGDGIGPCANPTGADRMVSFQMGSISSATRFSNSRSFGFAATGAAGLARFEMVLQGLGVLRPAIDLAPGRAFWASVADANLLPTAVVLENVLVIQ